MVAEADDAGLHANTDAAGRWLGNFALLEFEVSAGFGDESDIHFGHGYSLAVRDLVSLSKLDA
jgi:hypothetical protein